MTAIFERSFSRRTLLKAMGSAALTVSATGMVAPAIARAAKGELPKPDFARNVRMIGYTDMAGRPDGVQVMVNKSHAFVGHIFSNGFSVIDVSDPRSPRPVNFVAAPPDTWTPHLQTYEDLLLVINARNAFAASEFQDAANYYSGTFTTGASDAAGQPRTWSAGMKVYDIRDPADPRPIGFMPVLV